MAKEEDTKIEEAAAADNESSADKGDSGNAGEAQGGGNSPTQKNKTGLGHQLYAILNRRWVWGAALALALALTGIFVFGGTQWTKRNDTKASTLSKQKLIQDDLRQEPLSRFYVPLPQGSSDRVLVIDFSVVWDSLSAVRFRKMELQVRDRLYAFMMEQVARGNDLQEKVSFLESEVGRILRESLRTEDLAIKIKEIRAF